MSTEQSTEKSTFEQVKDTVTEKAEEVKNIGAEKTGQAQEATKSKPESEVSEEKVKETLTALEEKMGL